MENLIILCLEHSNGVVISIDKTNQGLWQSLKAGTMGTLYMYMYAHPYVQTNRM